MTPLTAPLQPTPAPEDSLPGAAVLSAPAAPLSLSEAQSLLHTHYGLSATLRPLSGERDANFLVTRTGQRCMLKISHPIESPLVADFQTQALLHMAATAPALPVQRLLPTRQGRPSVTVTTLSGEWRVMRLFSYLEGLPMPQAPRSAAQRISVAQALARVDLALAGLKHPAGQMELPWDIQQADRVQGLLGHVSDPARQALAERALSDFTARAKPLLPTLRRQPIHNDFNIYNLLVDPQAPDQVRGILDFGDMVEAPMVDDLAVAASYQIDESGAALATIAEFAAAYHAVLPLTSRELQVLPDLVRARLAMVVAISGWRAARQPDNADYLLRNNAVSWARLQALDHIPHEHACATLHRACGVARD